ncbi:MAG TPA: PH domain-containing protein, partial [Salinimicrobium sp.]|nr:PH domain-containing protein [Salinimicrobium sp.]
YGKGSITEVYSILPQKVVLTRNIFRWLIPLFIGLIILELSSYSVPFSWLGGFVLIYVLAVAVYQYFFFKTIRLSVSEEFLVKQYGLWNRKKQIIEMHKLQAVSVSRLFWYRKNLVNLTFHSAAGDISYTLLNRSEIIPLMDYLLYKIESTEKPWM